MNQKFYSDLPVGNNTELGFDTVGINTTCLGFVTITIPNHKPIEIRRRELMAFLLRTQPEFNIGLKVSAEPTQEDLCHITK